MKTFVTTLRSEATHHLHLAVFVTLGLLAPTHPAWAILFLAHGVWMWQKNKKMMLISMLGLGLVCARFWIFEQSIHELKGTVYEGIVVDVDEDTFILQTSQGRLLVYGITSLPIPGDQVLIEGEVFDLDVNEIPHNYDPDDRLFRDAISARFDASNCRFVDHHFHLLEFHERWVRQLLEEYPQDGPYLALFALGDDRALPEEMSAFYELGIGHLFALSGLHVGFVIAAFDFFLSRLFLTKSTKNNLSTILLVGYVVATGLSVSMIRAALLWRLCLTNKDESWFFSKVDVLSFLYVGMLIINPGYWKDFGFALSFLVTFAILLGEPFLRSKSQMRNLFHLQFLGFLASFPLIIASRSAFSLFSIPLGIIYYGLVSFVFLPGAWARLLFPSLSGIFTWMSVQLSLLTEAFVTWSPTISFSFVSVWLEVLFGVGILMLAIHLIHQRPIWKPIFFVFASISLSLLSSQAIWESKIVFLDVGQGDAIYLQSPGCRMLIDTGKKDDYDSVIHYLKGENITSLSAILITHFHADHVGELMDILVAINTEVVYASHEEEEYPFLTILQRGDQVGCGNLTLDVLSADQGDSNENNNSLVLKLVFGGDTYLLSGDIEAGIEQEIIERYRGEVDVLKVPHHGSDTSSTASFLAWASPKVSIISVGQNNYGHPSPSVLSRYEAIPTQLFQTDSEGTITISYYFGILRFVTSSSREDFLSRWQRL